MSTVIPEYEMGDFALHSLKSQQRITLSNWPREFKLSSLADNAENRSLWYGLPQPGNRPDFRSVLTDMVYMGACCFDFVLIVFHVSLNTKKISDLLLSSLAAILKAPSVTEDRWAWCQSTVTDENRKSNNKLPFQYARTST